jgi:hypothetical protein
VAACSTSLAIAVSQTSRGLASGLRAIAAPPTGPAVHHPRRGVLAAASKGGSGGGGKPGGSGKPSGGGGGSKQGGKKKGGEEDKADPNKADFSAYWSLRFREFFSGRRQYLELSRKRQEPPEIVQKVDAQIEEQQERLEEATQLKRCARVRSRGRGCMGAGAEAEGSRGMLLLCSRSLSGERLPRQGAAGPDLLGGPASSCCPLAWRP